jgi:hypothetical protein
LLIQIGMSIPRLSGLLINGVAGCVLVLALWYGLVALLLSVFDFGSSTWMPSIVSSARLLSIRALRQIVAASLPLFIYDNFWTFYVLAPRWIAATLTEASDAGRFAFGANLIWIGSGVFGTIAQVYYPRHLANRDHSALLREMIIVFGLASMGVMIAIPLCRYGMAFVFPRFAGAQAATAATLISAIPIVLISWGLPLIIAFSHRPIWESFISFGGSIIGLLLFMWLGDRIDGIVGQAFGLVVSAILLFGIMMGLLYRHAMMPRAASLLFFAGSASAIGFCTIEWWMVFYG